MHRFLQVSFNFGSRAKMEELEPVFTAIGDDWVRFSPLGWILWTDKPAPHVYTLLKGYLDDSDHILIAAFPKEPREMYAWLPRWIWDWLNSKRTYGSQAFLMGKDAEAFLSLPSPEPDLDLDAF